MISSLLKSRLPEWPEFQSRSDFGVKIFLAIATIAIPSAGKYRPCRYRPQADH